MSPHTRICRWSQAVATLVELRPGRLRAKPALLHTFPTVQAGEPMTVAKWRFLHAGPGALRPARRFRASPKQRESRIGGGTAPCAPGVFEGKVEVRRLRGLSHS